MAKPRVAKLYDAIELTIYNPTAINAEKIAAFKKENGKFWKENGVSIVCKRNFDDDVIYDQPIEFPPPSKFETSIKANNFGAIQKILEVLNLELE